MTRLPLVLGFLLGFVAIALAQAVGGNASISVSGTSSNVAIPNTTTGPDGKLVYPSVLLVPAYGTTEEIFYALGNSSVTATTSSASVPPNGICINVGPNTYIAAITSTSTATLRITQLSGCTTF